MIVSWLLAAGGLHVSPFIGKAAAAISATVRSAEQAKVQPLLLFGTSSNDELIWQAAPAIPLTPLLSLLTIVAARYRNILASASKPKQWFLDVPLGAHVWKPEGPIEDK